MTRRGSPLDVPLLFATFLSVAPASAQERTGFLDFNGYWDSRSAATYTVNALANLGGGVQYFSFVNYQGAWDAGSAELDGYYSEQHLRWSPSAGVPFDLTAFWNLRSGLANDAFYLGGRVRVSDVGALGRAMRRARISYSVTAHLVRFGDGDVEGWSPQLEQVYRWDVVAGRLYVSGFADHGARFGSSTVDSTVRTVTEHQAGYALGSGAYAVVEWRYNRYLPADRRSGWGVGLEYSLPFVLR